MPNQSVDSLTVILRDMANVSLGWEVEGIISPEESVSKMLKVIPIKNVEQSGTFWTWEGKVRLGWTKLKLADRFKEYPW